MGETLKIFCHIAYAKSVWYSKNQKWLNEVDVRKGGQHMVKFDEKKQIDSVNGALALRPQIEKIVDEIQNRGFDGIYFIGIGGTWASAMQVEVYMRGKSAIPVFVENASEFITTGNKRFTENSIVIFSSVTGSTPEMVKAVEKAHEIGAKVFWIH